ncbi:hypothetical protein J7399_13960 [Shimia sp. R9_1]|uniref:hypothetical protein n=1 Tax=Shimia sp. R9_1 TaxID=2821111 RepID=UPI001ADA6877|nr:hypothetical protein [Shimia sp. R9_1]MBO9408541.1 hypothetical protein [Shimia sp. R9_1]
MPPAVGFRIGFSAISAPDLRFLIAIFCFGLLAGFLPAWGIYRIALADGLATRLRV